MYFLKKMFTFFSLAILTSLSMAQANTGIEKAIQGRWLSEITQEIPGDEELINGVFKIIAVEEYLGNGADNMQGQMLMTFNYKDGSQITASWLVSATSEWQIKNSFLYEKIVDVRAIPDFVKRNGSLLSADEQKGFFQESGFKIDDYILKGQTSEDEIILINETSLSYKTKNDQGTHDVRSKSRTSAGFTLYRIK